MTRRRTKEEDKASSPRWLLVGVAAPTLAEAVRGSGGALGFGMGRGRGGDEEMEEEGAARQQLLLRSRRARRERERGRGRRRRSERLGLGGRLALGWLGSGGRPYLSSRRVKGGGMVTTDGLSCSER